nr:natural cytotoxicity triggering receptor 3-like [Pogona vitticeps]
MDLRTLHLMFILISGVWAQDLVVSQPGSTEATEGESVLLRCSYNSTSRPKVGSYWWVKDPGQLAVRNTTQEFMGRVIAVKDRAFLVDWKADIWINDLRHYDSGLYRCAVKLPGFREAFGNGTQLRVVKPSTGISAPPDNYMVLIWILLRGLFYAFGIGAVALGTCLYFEKTTQQNIQKRPLYHRASECRTPSRK